MRLVKVEHSKCDSFSKSEYFVGPDDLTNEQFQADVLSAQAAYFAARKEFEAMTPKPDPWIGWASQFEDERNGVTNDMTIGQAKALKERRFAESKAWQDKRIAVAGSFQTHLASLGYRTLYDAEGDMFTAEADWGHRHGQELRF